MRVSGPWFFAVTLRQLSAAFACHDGKQEGYWADKNNRCGIGEQFRGKLLLLRKRQSLCWNFDQFKGFESLPENPALGRIQGMLFVNEDAGDHDTVQLWLAGINYALNPDLVCLDIRLVCYYAFNFTNFFILLFLLRLDFPFALFHPVVF